jgi:hypothetical protein
MDDPLTPSSESPDRWPRDLRICAGICILWSAILMTRSIFNLSAGGVPLEDVIFGVKFYADQARATMALQAIIIAAFGIGILKHSAGA